MISIQDFGDFEISCGSLKRQMDQAQLDKYSSTFYLLLNVSFNLSLTCRFSSFSCLFVMCLVQLSVSISFFLPRFVHLLVCLSVFVCLSLLMHISVVLSLFLSPFVLSVAWKSGGWVALNPSNHKSFFCLLILNRTRSAYCLPFSPGVRFLCPELPRGQHAGTKGEKPERDARPARLGWT